MNSRILIGGVIALFVLLVGGLYYMEGAIQSVGPVACTMEAKLCPDGSAVGRSGPKCEFAACPGSTPGETAAPSYITLGAGAIGEVDGFTISWNAIVADSRCPVDVQCIWAGEVKVASVLSAFTGEKVTKIISTNDAPYLFAGYRVSVVAVSPAKMSATEIATSSYKIKFSIERDTTTEVSVKKVTIHGRVTFGPTCPVERMPPDPNCVPKPYVTTVQVINIASSNSAPFATVKTDSSGNYSVTVPAGYYAFQPVSGTVFPRCETKQAMVTAGTPLVIDLLCDSGIR